MVLELIFWKDTDVWHVRHLQVESKPVQRTMDHEVRTFDFPAHLMCGTHFVFGFMSIHHGFFGNLSAIQICPQSWRIKANLHHDDRCVFLEATLPFRIAVTWLSAKDIGNYQCLQVCTFNFKLHIQALQLHVMTWISCVPNKCSIVGNHFGLTHSWNGMK